MPSPIGNMVDGFSFPMIDLIVGMLDKNSIADIHLKLNYNAASVQSNLGCRTLGLLFLIVLPTVYDTLSNIVFVPPVNPGIEPNICAGATGTTNAKLWYHHGLDIRIFT